MTSKNIKLTEEESMVLVILERLEVGEKIKGKSLQTLTQIKKRELYAVINSLRKKGYAIGADKDSETGGYFMIRKESELLNWFNSTIKGANREIEAANKVLQRWYKENSNEKVS
ncbi:hypothetical protein H9636_02705 [Ureibacillus sp. Re31]|uniref:Uncharacterized protein n=1 Tax=Ureibacillus galli TaxID=2762222 RepID=A0ABR8X8C3_9BACL|nr:hypothetical protein [Ureibacillus galli]MBD8025561.1 hypothetical protein [Ureibacillus galli]